MDARLRAWIAAGALLAGSTVLFLLGQHAAAIPLVAASIALALLVAEQEIPPELPHQASASTTRSLARLADHLEIKGRGLHVPPASMDSLTRTRLFLPARDASRDELPPLTETTLIHRGPPGVLGLSLDPPGQALEQAWQDEHGSLPQGNGPTEAAQHLRQALPQLGIGTDVTVGTRDADGTTRIRIGYTHTALGELCRATKGSLAPWHEQGGCPVCSLAATLCSHAMNAPVRYHDLEPGLEDDVTLELEVLGSSTA